jgi:hypothetical protein
MKKYPRSGIQNQKGYLLFEYLVASVLIVSLLVAVALALQERRERDDAQVRAGWIAQYMMAIGSYITRQGAAAPAVLVRNGTDWLKSNTCGGIFAPDEQHLPCAIPTDFNGDYGLAPPIVNFDWSNPQAPLADVNFGVVNDISNQPSAVRAAQLRTAANAKMNSVNFSFAQVFTVDPTDPATDPVVNPGAFVARLNSGALGGIVDAGAGSSVFVRLDGNVVMTGPLINQNDNWSLLGRDSAGVENADPASPVASANLNDVFVRSSQDAVETGYWVSETHTLAREAFELAVRAPNFINNVRSGSNITKPSCPGGLIPGIYAAPAGFIGGDGPPNVPGGSAFVSGIRVIVTDNVATWNLTMEALFDGSTGFEPIPAGNPEMGLIQATIKCEDP